MKRRGRGFADGADVNAGDEADVSDDVPRAKTRAASRDASPSDVPDWPVEDGARVSDLARLGDDICITPEKHAMTRANDDDDDAPYTSPEVLEVLEVLSPDLSIDTTECPSAYDVAVDLASPVAADRARLEALLEDASRERAAGARAAALLAGLENEARALDASACTFRETVTEKKRVAETFAAHRLRASKAAVALAARFMSREDDARDAMRRWRRLAENRKHAVAAAKRARRRHALRSARRAVHRWAEHAARAAGGARLVATRFAAARRRARLNAAARAWRGVVEETGRRRALRARAADLAARKARVRVTRVARDALARWRLWTRARAFMGSRGIGAAGAGEGVFFREDGVAGDSDRPERKKNARVDAAAVESVSMAAMARFLFGGDAAAVFARSRVARATRRVLETSRVSSFAERKIGGVSKASCALGGFVLGGRLAHSAAEASARSKRRLAEAEIARLRRRVDELLDARVEDDRALGESITDPDASVEASDKKSASALFATRESLAACSRAREADAETLAVSESDRASATRLMRGAIEDKRIAESDRANAIEAMERSGAEAREARDALSDALERRLDISTRLFFSFPPGDTNTRYEYELHGLAPDFVASASLVALIAITSLAIACVAFFARASRRLRRRVSAEARASQRAAAAAAASREAASKLRLELAASEASKVAAVEEVKRQARGDVENASAMMARLTSLAEKAETSARAHRDENEALATQNAEMKTFVTSLEMKVSRAELLVATHEAARERSRRRKRERGDARVVQSRDDASAESGRALGKETEPVTEPTSPSKLPARRLAPFEPEAATAAAARTTAERTPTPTSAPTSPLRASRSVVQRVMGWNARIERAGV